ncbi:uncharacterized protein LOC111695938 [Eurytemora carolleeae]|uniref:uncharacterized protein LOC111695938 n=1 Tax=Eurytemora carolleeae TaxID=1294199 RepID=UPI000C758E6E|nr:uncharacterized protein LOC111695938 [Eurytemora carolleeae]|eukprot:XP_023321184.1 uncharacterized protein LOC111695938 [Eurytemora affinis]
MGAPPIYSLAAARRSGGMLSNVSPVNEGNGNGISGRGMQTSSYERHLKVGIDEEPCNGSMCNSEVISPSFFGRPFSAGALQQSRWNPFKKKSGILGVIHAQSKRNRVVSKHGKLNTFRRAEENEEQHSETWKKMKDRKALLTLNFNLRYLKDFFTSMIDLPWSWTLFSFAASFFFSWFLFAVVWYILVLIHGDLVPLEERDPEHKESYINYYI